LTLKKRECYYCKTDVTEGERLRISLMAGKAKYVGTSLQSSGQLEKIYVCSDCSRDYFELIVMGHSNTHNHLKLILQRMIPTKRIKKREWNPTER